ncbi:MULTISPECIES: FtsX-like permease family protein [unclassified Methylibium]|uniref:ABC transporter permease n=1 Tax=unclassified Methylibium TaxID=2633235 RepID=UPI0003F43AB8|nr:MULTISPECIES: FtsX-like permease family protein [unclassified Methylibium]EWS54585.1 acidobacterial duplicated orphan permease [Methylibium sp. T29]EWS59018.1 acidobacterial duplicated orphan permease [Methylibium sp. T29-B]
MGTTPDYFGLLDASGRGPAGVSGDDLARPFDAVVGAKVARQAGLAVGSRFVASHGLVELPAELATEHAERAYRVTAVLPATGAPADRAIFTALETAWSMHEHEHEHEGEAAHSAPAAEGSPRAEITALLVQGRSYGDMARIAASLARDTRVQAVVPGREVTRLLQYLRAGEEVVLGLAWLATAVAFFAVMLAMAAAGIDRRRQIATLRALGASRATLARLLIAESLLIAGAGAALGFVLGRGAAAAIAWHVEGSRGFSLQLTGVTPGELAAPAAALLLGLVAGAVPAYFTCREDIAPHLSNAP